VNVVFFLGVGQNLGVRKGIKIVALIQFQGRLKAAVGSKLENRLVIMFKVKKKIWCSWFFQ
jgi:hypothetical protein